MTWAGNQVARVTAKLFSDESGFIENVFHLRKDTGSSDNDDAIDAIGEWIEVVYTNLLGQISEEADFDSINIFLLDTDEALGDLPWPTITVGLATGAMQASGLALLSSAITGISRRVGRKYWGPMTVNGFLDSDWPTGMVSAAADAAVDAYTAYVAANGVAFTPGVYDRLFEVLRVADTTRTVSNPAYQRRRRQGVGI